MEPFQIPSGSMVPTLAIGDFILVSKFTYGLRVPFTGAGSSWKSVELVPLGEPARGDIAVFVYPPSQEAGEPIDYIKRVVGMPGDTVEVRDQIVYINGAEQTRTDEGSFSFVNTDGGCSPEETKMMTEQLGDHPHVVLQTAYRPQMADWGPKVVPEGHYFVMGDNRDHSSDSRVWGFVPRENIKGKALFVWLSFDRCEGDIPALGSVRFNRIGTVLN